MSWGGFFDYANRKNKVEQDRQLSLSPGFWDDNTRATATMKEIKVNESIRASENCRRRLYCTI